MGYGMSKTLQMNPSNKQKLSVVFIKKSGIEGDDPMRILQECVAEQIQLVSDLTFLEKASKSFKRFEEFAE